MPPKLLAEWKTIYAKLDVPHEIEKARQWLLAKPKQRLKTHRGMRAFLVNWFNRAEKGPPDAAPVLDPPEPEDNCDRRFKLMVELRRDRELTHAEIMRILDDKYPVK